MAPSSSFGSFVKALRIFTERLYVTTMPSAFGPIASLMNSFRRLNIRLRFCGWMFWLST